MRGELCGEICSSGRPFADVCCVAVCAQGPLPHTPTTRNHAAMKQDALRNLWKAGQKDRLSPWMQAMALAFREASKEIEKYKNPKNKQPNLAWVATKVARMDGQNPSPQGLGEFFKKVDADQDWFPGKHTGAKRGPAPIFTPVKRRAVAECAMEIKQRGDEPTAEEVVQRCKVSTTNPDTGKPFDFKLIRQVFATDCYDFFPE